MDATAFLDRVAGCLIGGAAGDAFGGPMECVPAADNLRIFGAVRRFAEVDAAMIRAAGEARGKVWWTLAMWGEVTDDTALADLLVDCILRHDGEISAYEFADEWRRLEDPVSGPDGRSVVRLDRLHWIERIALLRNRLRTVNKRDLGRGEEQATNALMFCAAIGLLHAGDPLAAEQAAVDLCSVNQHGASRDAGGGYAAAIAHAVLPCATAASIVDIALHHLRDERTRHEVGAILAVARACATPRAFIDRYWTEILGRLIPMQDWQHHGTGSLTTWSNSEVLGVSLGMLLITGGDDGLEMLRHCALNGRDADTTCRVAAGLLGAWRGRAAIPADWQDTVIARNGWLRLEEKSARLAECIRRRIARRRAALAAVLDPAPAAIAAH